MTSILQRLRSSSTSTSTSTAPGPAAPPFLSLPLSDPHTLSSITQILSEREDKRRIISSNSHENCLDELRIGGPKGIGMGKGRSRAPSPTPVLVVEKKEIGRGYYDCSIARESSNVRKNRYFDILAYDRTRILSPSSPNEYVNASLIHEPTLPGIEIKRRWWIASQAPLISTLHAFLSLLLHPPSSPSSSSGGEEGLPLVNLIVQLTPLVEQKRDKCHPYFPKDPTEPRWDIPPLSGSDPSSRGLWVRLKEKKVENRRRVSTLRIGWKGDEEGREVRHVEYLGWGDHGVPDDPKDMLNFMSYINSLNRSLSGEGREAPILLHCSAGVGRTGTYITISSLLPLLSRIRKDPSFLYVVPPATEKVRDRRDEYKTPPPPTPPFSSLSLSSPTFPTHSSSSASEPLPPYPINSIPGIPSDFIGATIDGLREQRTTMVQNQKQVGWCWIALGEAWSSGVGLDLEEE